MLRATDPAPRTEWVDATRMPDLPGILHATTGAAAGSLGLGGDATAPEMGGVAKVAQASARASVQLVLVGIDVDDV